MIKIFNSDYTKLKMDPNEYIEEFKFSKELNMEIPFWLEFK